MVRLLLLFRLFLTYVWISGYNDIKSLLFIGCVCVCGCYRWGDLLFVMLMATFMVLHNIYLMVSYAVAYMYFSFPQSVSNFMSKLTFRFISMPRLKNATKIPSSWSPAATFFFLSNYCKYVKLTAAHKVTILDERDKNLIAIFMLDI